MFKKLLLITLLSLSLIVVQSPLIFAHPGDDDFVYYYRYPSTDLYATAISYGTSAWNSSGAGVFIAAVSNVNDSSVEVEVLAVNSPTSGWDGVFYDNLIGHDTIQFNSYFMNGYSNAKRQSVICHEFGHTWPLADQPKTAKLVMNLSTYDRYDLFKINTPQAGDVTNVKNR